MSGDDEYLKDIPGKCPSPLELGVSGWNILHSSAAVYPYKPSEVQRAAMKSFIESWAHVYACSWCAYHMRDYVQKNPPDVKDKLSVSRYVCELHNEVNTRLGKDVFDCSPDVVLRRWHPGFPDKMEDKPTIEEQLAMAAKQQAETAAARRRQQEAEERRFSDFGLQSRHAAPREAAGWRETAAAMASGKNELVSGHSGKKESDSSSGSGGGRWWFFGSSAFSQKTPAAPASAGVADEAATRTAATSVVPPADMPRTASATTVTTTAAASRGGASWNTAHAGSATLPQTPSRAKAADDETDVDAVLERLKRCQVYCPEDEALQKH